MTNNTARLFPMWMETLGLNYIFHQEKFKGAPFNFASREDCIELRRIILNKMQEKTLDEWLDLYIQRGLAGDRFQSTQECMDHPQTIHNTGARGSRGTQASFRRVNNPRFLNLVGSPTRHVFTRGYGRPRNQDRVLGRR